METQTLAGQAIEAYFARLRETARTRFDPPGTKKETDPALKGVRFYRFEDGSMVRFDPGGDVQEC